MNLLISYSHQDVIFARALKRALERFEMEVWLDEHDMSIGDSIPHRLASVILQSDFVVVVISPRSLASQWVNWELSVAHRREQLDGTSRILPILIEGEFVPAILAQRLYADFRTSRSQQSAFSKLIAVLLQRQSKSGGLPYNVDLFRPSNQALLRVPTQAPPAAKEPLIKYEISPMVGTVYLAPNPDSKPLVDVGKRIRAGDPLVIIEAMKTLNEIEATFSGAVLEILVENGEPIEFGQPIVAIRLD